MTLLYYFQIRTQAGHHEKEPFNRKHLRLLGDPFCSLFPCLSVFVLLAQHNAQNKTALFSRRVSMSLNLHPVWLQVKHRLSLYCVTHDYQLQNRKTCLTTNYTTVCDSQLVPPGEGKRPNMPPVKWLGRWECRWTSFKIQIERSQWQSVREAFPMPL